MAFETWRDLYASDLQSRYALAIPQVLFLLYLLTADRRASRVLPDAAGFVRRYALVFAVETILDMAAGPTLHALGLGDTPLATAVTIAFVLIGDLRVFLLVFALAAYARDTSGRRGSEPPEAPLPPGVFAAAVRWTLIVPAATTAIMLAALAASEGLPVQTVWLVYELAFLAVALVLRARVVASRVPPAQSAVRDYLRAVVGYAALYYALWAAADVAILAGSDLGWALRIVPNQLYYAFFVPFAYWRFFSRR